MKENHGGNVFLHPGCLDFSANLHPLGMPETVRQAIREAASCAEFYPDPECSELRSVLAEKEGVLPEQVICGNGAADLIFLLCRALMPSKTLLPVPSFSEYEKALRSVGCRISRHVLQSEEDFLPDSTLPERIRREKPDLVFLCNPNNPTGKLWPAGLVEEILAGCRVSGTFLAVDECFMDFVDPGQAFSLVSRIKKERNLFVLKAFTKNYGMAGVRLGYGICGDPGVLERMREQSQAWNVSLIAQKAGIAALQDPGHIRKGREIIEKERTILTDTLRSFGMTVCDSQANFLLFRISPGLQKKMQEQHTSLFAELLKKKILIRDCGNFSGLEEGHYRIAVKTREENQRLIRAMEEILAEERAEPAESRLP